MLLSVELMCCYLHLDVHYSLNECGTNKIKEEYYNEPNVYVTSGDVHPNPGPSSMPSYSSSSNFSNSLNDSFSFLNTLNLSKHLSFIHYNVQSIANKLDILTAELSDFDILAFSETWLHAAIQTTDLLMPNFKPPERKDRARDHHGGVMIYVKDSVHYTRRNDLDP